MTQKLGRTIDVYHNIFKKAWRRALDHKALWIFGLFAALLNTGTIFYRTLSMATNLQPLDTYTIDHFTESSDRTTWLVHYVLSFLTEGPLSMSVAFIISLILILTILLLALGGQQLLITGLQSKKTRSAKELLRELSRTHLLQLLYVNILLFMTLVLLFGTSSYILSTVPANGSSANAFIYLGVYLLLIPVALIVNAIGMVALIHVVQSKRSAVQAIKHSMHLISTHWLATFEMILGLFFINLIASILLVGVIALITVLASMAAALTVSSGTIILATIFMTLAVAFIVLMTFFYIATMTVFAYAAWIEFVSVISRGRIIPAIEHLFRSFTTQK